MLRSHYFTEQAKQSIGDDAETLPLPCCPEPKKCFVASRAAYTMRTTEFIHTKTKIHTTGFCIPDTTATAVAARAEMYFRIRIGMHGWMCHVCYAMVCYAKAWYVMLCYAVLRCAMASYGIVQYQVRNATLCVELCRCAMLMYELLSDVHGQITWMYSVCASLVLSSAATAELVSLRRRPRQGQAVMDVDGWERRKTHTLCSALL